MSLTTETPKGWNRWHLFLRKTSSLGSMIARDCIHFTCQNGFREKNGQLQTKRNIPNFALFDFDRVSFLRYMSKQPPESNINWTALARDSFPAIQKGKIPSNAGYILKSFVEYSGVIKWKFNVDKCVWSWQHTECADEKTVEWHSGSCEKTCKSHKNLLNYR